MKTLKDIYDKEDWHDIEALIDNLHNIAREWIKHLEKQRELHWEWINKGVGENPDFEYPKGFNHEEAHSLGSTYMVSDSYQEIIDWIKRFFNLGDK